MKFLLIVGTRPNIIKIAPIIRELNNRDIDYKLIHTGQHYDDEMSNVFFKELEVPRPNINFNISGLSDSKTIGSIIIGLEDAINHYKPDIMIVVGDVNSTLAAALTANKCKIKLAHIESGERNKDKSLPEEINRILTDHLSDYLFCTTRLSINNLVNEGIEVDKIHLVGNVMVDQLKYVNDIKTCFYKTNKEKYALMTMHRQDNVDNPDNLLKILNIIELVSEKIKIIFPMHPRTKKQIAKNGFRVNGNIKVIEPQSYINFMNLLIDSEFVITDSGGLQVEATVLNKSIITLATTTPHLFTIEKGKNYLAGIDKERILYLTNKILTNKVTYHNFYDKLWDGKVSKRIIDILTKN